MTNEEAIKILHPDSTFEALTEIEYYNGFNGHEAKISAVNEACILACEALEKQIPKKPFDICEPVVKWGLCPCCKGELNKLGKTPNRVFASNRFCMDCGQALDWSEEE